MNVLIKDMEKPKSCYEVIDGENEYCPFVNTDDECVLLLNKGICESSWEMQYSKCPLVEVPEPCEDAVNRRKLLNELEELIAAWKKYPVMAEQIKGVEAAIEYVKTIPSVTPKRKIGRWIEEQRGIEVTLYKCSECGRAVIDDTSCDAAKDFPFCRCGADMRQREEE
jgi:hypothetical protein